MFEKILAMFGKILLFILPEKTVSLKLLFDNFRNYIICGAFLAMSVWFESATSAEHEIPGLFPSGKTGGTLVKWPVGPYFSWIAIGFFWLFFVLNMWQSWLIFIRALHGLLDPDELEPSPQTDGPSPRSDGESSESGCVAEIVIFLLVLLFAAALISAVSFLLYVARFAAFVGHA
jgi:hypothetical protein